MIRNLYELVLNHQGKVIDNTQDTSIDAQLGKVQDFINDLTIITNEISREIRVFQFARSQSLSDIIRPGVKDIKRTQSSGMVRLKQLNT